MAAKFVDQIGEKLEISSPPKKIISLVPSQTELLHHLGLGNEVIGITKFCVHPNNLFREKVRIGGTKSLKIEKIKELQPDLILANKEENNQSEVEELKKYFPVWTSDVKTISDSFQMIKEIGKIVGKSEKAHHLETNLKKDFGTLNFAKKTKSAYLIWNDPIMVSGGDTFINSMMNLAGFENLFLNENRYPSKTIDQLKKANPEAILLSSEPFPFKQKHIDFFQKAIPKAKIKLVDGEIFSWYGSRMLHAKDYFQKLRTDF